MEKNIMDEIAKLIIIAKGRDKNYFVKDHDDNLKMNQNLINKINEHITNQAEKAKNNYSYYTGTEKVDIWELMDSSLGLDGWAKYDNVLPKNVFKFDPPKPNTDNIFNFSKETVSRESQWDLSDKNDSTKSEETKKDEYDLINNKED